MLVAPGKCETTPRGLLIQLRVFRKAPDHHRDHGAPLAHVDPVLLAEGVAFLRGVGHRPDLRHGKAGGDVGGDGHRGQGLDHLDALGAGRDFDHQIGSNRPDLFSHLDHFLGLGDQARIQLA